MNNTRNILVTILATVLISAAAISSSQASAITLVVVDSDSKETEYSVPDFTNDRITLPIYLNGHLHCFKACFPEDEKKQVKEAEVSIDDPSIVIPGVAWANGGGCQSGPLTIYSATIPLQHGKRVLIFKTSKYSIWIQYDPTKSDS